MERAILEHVLRYLRSQDSLADFESWFVPATWGINQSSDREAVAVARRISLRLAEFLNGHWTEDEFRDRLAELLLARAKPVPELIRVGHAVVSNSTLGAGESRWFALPDHRIAPGIALIGTPATQPHRLRTKGGNLLVGTGKMLNRPE
jgi:hypothetical protein